MSAQVATIVSLGLVALYTPLSIAAHALVSRLPTASRRPMFLEAGIAVLTGVLGIVALLLSASGQALTFFHFLVASWPSGYWYPAAATFGALLYVAGSRMALPVLRRVFGWLGLAVSPPRSGWSGSAIIRSYLSPWVWATMPLVNLMEESLWRGFTVFALTSFGVSATAACLIASVFYGTYHYALGTHHAALNGANGFAYGLLFIKSGNILVPLCAHLVYNVLAIVPMRRALKEIQLLEKGANVHGY